MPAHEQRSRGTALYQEFARRVGWRGALDRDSVLAAGSGSGTNIGAEIGRSEPWHRVCLLMGVAGAGTGERAIIMTGIAGLIGGACSMVVIREQRP